MNLRNKRFVLIDNSDGLAASNTVMVFDNSCAPYQATYSGPNVTNGHVLVLQNGDEHHMLYHAIAANNKLVAGKALVTFPQSSATQTIMQLQWQWLTGDLSSGVSLWHEVSENNDR